MRIIRKTALIGRTCDDSTYQYEANVYSLPFGETYNEEYADMVWALYRKHCIKCPYKIPERSIQFKKVCRKV